MDWKAAVGLMVLAVLLLPIFGVGIGLAPSRLDIPDAVRGVEYERSIVVFNPDDAAANFALRAGGEAGGWVSFYDPADPRTPINKVSVAGRGNSAVLVRISVPGDSATGAYNATIYAETLPAGSNGTVTGVSTVLVANTLVLVGVTGNQVLDGAVTAVSVEDTEPAYPVRVKTAFKNTGNVVAKPAIQVDIRRGNSSVKMFAYGSPGIRPGSTGTLVAEWNTSAAEPVGDYFANVTVSLDGRVLRSELLQFKLLPLGTLTRQGNLTDMRVEGDPAVNNLMKITSYFRNTGTIATSAKFSGEVYLDGKLIDTLASDELNVGKNEETRLVSYMRPSAPGNYVIKGRVLYGGKETGPREASFTVPTAPAVAQDAVQGPIQDPVQDTAQAPAQDAAQAPGLGYLAIILGAIVLLFVAIATRSRRDRKAAAKRWVAENQSLVRQRDARNERHLAVSRSAGDKGKRRASHWPQPWKTL